MPGPDRRGNDRNPRGGNHGGGFQRGGGGNGSGGQRGDQYQQPVTPHAPYNFVPLSSNVVIPEWGHLVTHDVPFKDGFSGSIDVTIEAVTPMIVGGGGSRRGPRRDRNGHTWNGVEFFLDASGRPAIPGSTLKGVIRNVVEIAAFGKMQGVDDQHLGLRDLRGAKSFYVDRMTETKRDRNKKTFTSRVHSGFLRFSPSAGWEIVPCSYGRISHRRLRELEVELEEKDIRPGHPTCAEYMRSIGLADDGFWRLYVDPATRPAPHPMDAREPTDLRYIDFDRCVRLEAIGKATAPATLVVTGFIGKKTKEFLFFDDTGGFRRPAVSVPKEVIRAFEAIHRSQLDAESTTPWKYWQNRLLKRRLDDPERIGPGSANQDTFPGIPVFYLASDGAGRNVQAIGLAQMFKLPYDLSIRDTIDNTSTDHREAGTNGEHPWDMAELLFGTVSKVEGRTLKGRVSFGLAHLVEHGNAMEPFQDQPPLVLNSPKPTYYPFYVRQPLIAEPRDAPGNGGSGSKYLSYTMAGRGDGAPPLPEVAGWKRYLPRARVCAEPRATQENQSVATMLRTIKAGATFRSKIRFHNLRSVELGALLWACTLGRGGGGNQPVAVGKHLVGGGKPYGYGRTIWSLDNIKLVPNLLPGADEYSADRNGEDWSNLRQALADFEAYMDRKTRHLGTRWRQSGQIVALETFADETGSAPFVSSPPYMALRPRGPNDFAAVKSAKKALPRIGTTTPPPESTGGPSKSAKPDWLRD